MKADLIGEPYPTDDESYGPDAVPVCGSILTEAGAVGPSRRQSWDRIGDHGGAVADLRRLIVCSPHS
jgi:hypothetical protein